MAVLRDENVPAQMERAQTYRVNPTAWGTGQLVPTELCDTRAILDIPEAHGARRLGRDEHTSCPSLATLMLPSGPRLFPLRPLGACAPNANRRHLWMQD
ncbi:hypothetical protein N7523_010514 [Penicillium sp. IBT 18751x]|nr:hypothetical protein N7523_010514 [Penicillium sp. IBT 18751x]